jgi:hypothetical protein
MSHGLGHPVTEWRYGRVGRQRLRFSLRGLRGATVSHPDSES